MAETTPIAKVQSELEGGMGLAKCRQCGCMQDSLERMWDSPSLQAMARSDLLKSVETWLCQMRPVRYT